jgi:hypothetical protein
MVGQSYQERHEIKGQCVLAKMRRLEKMAKSGDRGIEQRYPVG